MKWYCALTSYPESGVKMGIWSSRQHIQTIHSIIDQEEVEFESKEPNFPSNLFRDEYIIGGISPRREESKRIDTNSIWPHSVHGRFIATFEDGSLQGSGTIIGPNLVLTCAHNVYKREIGIEADKNGMTFYSGMKGSRTSYEDQKVLEVYYPEEYKSNENEDYALVVLGERIGDHTGYFGIKHYNKDSLQNRKANLYVYSEDESGKREKEDYSWEMEGSFHIDSFDMIDHNMDTSSSQSGSAVYIVEGDSYYIIGVHIKSTDSSTFQNKAVYLNEARIKRIKGWIKDYYKKYNIVREIDCSNIEVEQAFNLLIYLIDTRNLANLCVVRLTNFEKEPVALRLAYTDLKSLLILDLSFCDIGDEGSEALSKANLINLQELNLSFNFIKHSGAAAISQANCINLTTLDLSGNDIQIEGACALSEANLIHLTSLDLSHNQIGDQGTTAISKSNFPNLTNLNLANNLIFDSGASALSQADFIHLKDLNLSTNNIGDEGINALSESKFINLLTLNLSENQIGDKGVAALSKSEFINLKELILSDNHIGNEGILALSRGKFMNISTLDLSWNKFGDEGIYALCEANFTSLTTLDLFNYEIGGEAMRKIKNKFIYAKIQ